MHAQYYPGPPIACVLRGDNFGLFRPGNALAFRTVAAQPASAGTAAEILSWNDTVIQFNLPAGAGANLVVAPVVSGQAPSDGAPYFNDAPVIFSYDPPSLLAIGRADRTLDSCAPVSLCFRSNSSTFCTTAPAQCYDTAGGEWAAGVRRSTARPPSPLYVPSFLSALLLCLPLPPHTPLAGYQVQLVGQSFGRSSAVVTINGKSCSNANATDYVIVCTMPQGVGSQAPVVVTVAGRSSNAINFAYDPPIVATVQPSTPDANGQAISFVSQVAAKLR